MNVPFRSPPGQTRRAQHADCIPRRPSRRFIRREKTLVGEIFTALDEAYRVPDTRIFIREWPPENVSQDGRLDAAPPRPVLFLEVPPGITVGEKRAMGKRISAAVTAAYHLADVLIFLREYPLDMVIQDGGLQSENR
jgi:hypothetical protein